MQITTFEISKMDCPSEEKLEINRVYKTQLISAKSKEEMIAKIDEAFNTAIQLIALFTKTL